jgi:hypothetical protein
VVDWLIELGGDKLGLRALSRLLRSPDCRISEEGGRYYLRAADLGSLTDASDVKRTATERIAQLTGAANALFGNIEPVEVVRVIRVEPEGNPPTQFILPGSIVMRGRGLLMASGEASDTTMSSSERTALESWDAIANRDAAVGKALRSFASGEGNPYELWKVYEIVRDDLGGKKSGKKRIIDNGWATTEEIEAFEHALNCPVALGDKARHAVKDCTEETHMPLARAESLVRGILVAWVGGKAG